MADMYDATTCSSSSSPEHDDISFFLQQILFRSSSSSSSSSALMAHDGKQAQSLSPPHLMPQNPHISNPSPFVSASDRLVKDQISAAESSSGLNSCSGAGQFAATAANVYSSSVGTVDNDGDEYDCESEEGFEALAEEVPARQAPGRNHSKRSRAAEVHNLSEKRRRSRINEKMKALQNLIPNSNKTDKASMLDEAIEYLKQLQLQVQMLTMRNGLSLYPMCLPGVLQPNQLSQMRMDFYEGNRSLNMNMTGAVPVNQETMMNTVFSVSNQCSNPNFPSVGNLSSIINSETSFAPQSSIQSHFRPFQLHPSSEEICREDFLHDRQLNVGHSEANPLEFQMEAERNMSIPFDKQVSEIKDNTLEACILPRQRSGGAILTNPECDRVLCHQLNGIDTGPSAPNDDVKTLRHNMTS